MTEWDKPKGTLIGMIDFNAMTFSSATAVPATDGPQLRMNAASFFGMS
jgi:hypothetical protein